MEKKEFAWMLAEIAKVHHTTSDQVRKEMQLVMDEGQRNPDPMVRRKWEAIPRSGTDLTLEEFVDYLVHSIRLSCDE